MARLGKPPRSGRPVLGDGGSQVDPTKSRRIEAPTPVEAPLPPAEEHSGRGQQTLPQLELLGDEALGPAQLQDRPAWFVARHLMVLLARTRGDREAALSRVSELVCGLNDPLFAKRVLFTMAEAGRIVAELDSRALATGRRIGPGLATEVLDAEPPDA